MINRIIHLHLFSVLLLALIAGQLSAADISFSSSASNGLESTDPNIPIVVTGTGNISFIVKLDNPETGTATHNGGTWTNYHTDDDPNTYTADDYDNIYNQANLAGSGNYYYVTIDDSYPTSPTTVYVSIAIDADNNWEGGSGTYETIGLTIEVDDWDETTTSTHTYSIQDDDTRPSLSFVADNSSADEYDGYSYIYVYPSGTYRVGTTATVVLSLTNGTSSDNDHSHPTGFNSTTTHTLTIAENPGWARFYYRAAHDTQDEPDETFEISFSSAEQALINGSITTHTHTINDNDAAPDVYFSSAGVTVNEDMGGQSNLTATVVLSEGSGYDNTSINYTVTGTATGNNGAAEHNLSDNSVTFSSAGDDTEDITFTITDDTFFEGATNETIILTLSSPTLLTLDDTRQITYTVSIGDNDATPVLDFHSNASYAPASGTEATASPDIRLEMNAATGYTSGLATTATISLSSATATVNNGSNDPYDFTLYDTGATYTITIPAYSSSSAAIDLTIVDDDYYEANENIVLAFTALTNASGSGTHTYTLTQDDSDDPKPVIGFQTSGPTSVTEGAATTTTSTNITVTLNASGGSGLDVGFTYSVTDLDALSVGADAETGTDFTDVGTGTGTISAYSQTVTIPFEVIGDAIYELDHTVALTMALAGGEEDASLATDGTAVHNVTIVDDDSAPIIQFTEGSLETTEPVGASGVTITIDKSGSTELTATVTLADAGTGTATDNNDADLDDYDVTNMGTVSFGPSDTQKSFTLTVDNDELYEGSTDETANFTLTALTNSTISGNTALTFSIEDNEAIPTIYFHSGSDDSGAETTGSPTLTVTLSGKSAFASTIDYSAAAKAGQATTNYVTSGDYTLSANTLTIAANSLTGTVPLSITTDALYELAEIITVSLANPCDAADSYCSEGTNQSHDYTINASADSDQPVLDFAATASSFSEANGSGTVTVELSTATGYPATVTHGISGTSTAAGSGVDYTYTAGGLTFYPELADGTAAVTSKTIPFTFTDDATNEPDLPPVDPADNTLSVAACPLFSNAQSAT